MFVQFFVLFSTPPILQLVYWPLILLERDTTTYNKPKHLRRQSLIFNAEKKLQFNFASFVHAFLSALHPKFVSNPNGTFAKLTIRNRFVLEISKKKALLLISWNRSQLVNNGYQIEWMSANQTPVFPHFSKNISNKKKTFKNQFFYCIPTSTTT